MRQRFVISIVVAILAAWTFRGLTQYFIDNPETHQYYLDHRDEIIKSHGWKTGDPQITLFESRMNSQEVTGFVTFSNVMAEGMVPMLLIAGSLGVLTLCTKWRDDNPIPLHWLAGGALLLLFVCGLITAILTQSKGANSIFIICTLAFAAIFAFRKNLWPRWKLVVGFAFLAFLIGAAATVAYGIRHDALPSRSLLFRWHYWRATVPLVQARPLLGVGLNNYGDYYTEVKRLSAPEDVKDPHSFIVRFAAEIGVPAMVLALLLVGVYVWRAARTLAHSLADGSSNASPAKDAEPLTIYVLAIAFIVIWWVARFYAAEIADSPYAMLISLFYGGSAAAGFAAAWEAQRVFGQIRPFLIAAILGALGMFIYDQVNMAIVTGSVAMLFWMLLNCAGSNHESERLASASLSSIFSISIGAVSIAMAGLFWIPVLTGTFTWDPRIDERAMLRAYTNGSVQQAYDAAEAALRKVPRSEEYLHWKINFAGLLHRDSADDIRRALAMDRTNIAMRLEYATRDSSLTIPERIKAIQEALQIDDVLEKGEPKHLSPEQRQHAKAALQILRSRAETRP